MTKGKSVERRVGQFSIVPHNAILIDDLVSLEESRFDTYQPRAFDLGGQD